MGKSPPKILCVDDDKDTCDLVAYMFKEAGFEVVTAETAAEGRRLARERCFAAIILDSRIREASGVELCKEIRGFDAQTPIIFFTASAYAEDKQAGLDAGAQAYLVKPDDVQRLVETVRSFTVS
jgi:DNA-binding response OmpR family regulator